jgi:hypothetical protein
VSFLLCAAGASVPHKKALLLLFYHTCENITRFPVKFSLFASDFFEKTVKNRKKAKKSQNVYKQKAQSP